MACPAWACPGVRGASNIPPIGQMGKPRPLFRIIGQMSSVGMGVWSVGTESPVACLAPPAPASGLCNGQALGLLDRAVTSNPCAARIFKTRGTWLFRQEH